MGAAQTLDPKLVAAMSEHIQATFREVAPMILEQAGDVAFTDKQDGTPVTEMDRAVESKITKSMKAAFPDIPVFGEETGYQEDALPTHCWLIDPIDGTKSFIKNAPYFTCMAVLISNKETVACVIYNPSTDEMFTAQKGLGAYKNGARLNVAETPLSDLVYCKDTQMSVIQPIVEPAHVTCRIAPTGAGYGFGAVADGTTAARFQIQSKGYLHDYATGLFLVQEAGATIVPVSDAAIAYDSRSFVVCHPKLEALVRANLAQLRELDVQN